jgi:hypothetical protein
MKNNFIGSCVLLVLLSMCLLSAPARAGDRKDSGARDARSDSGFSDFVTGSLAPHSGAARHGATGLFITNSDSKTSRSERDATTKEKESEPTPGKERKKIILFQFDRKFGDVSVQPVVGQVNGAQLAIGF